MAFHPLHLRISPDLHRQLAEAAAREHNTIASLVRRYVALGLARENQRQP